VERFRDYSSGGRVEMMRVLEEEERRDFKDWYDLYRTLLRLSPDPYDLRHHYDYEAAWRAGAKPDESGHFPSRFKSLAHPSRFVEGIDTATGKRARPEDVEASKRLQLLFRELYRKEGE